MTTRVLARVAKVTNFERMIDFDYLGFERPIRYPKYNAKQVPEV